MEIKSPRELSYLVLPLLILATRNVLGNVASYERKMLASCHDQKTLNLETGIQRTADSMSGLIDYLINLLDYSHRWEIFSLVPITIFAVCGLNDIS